MKTSASDPVVAPGLELPADEFVATVVARARRLRQRALQNHAVDQLALRASGLLAVQWGADNRSADPWALAG